MSKIIATKVHRVWITNPTNQHLIGLISLTDMIGLFYEKSFKTIDEADREKELDTLQGQGDDEDY